MASSVDPSALNINNTHRAWTVNPDHSGLIQVRPVLMTKDSLWDCGAFVLFTVYGARHQRLWRVLVKGVGVLYTPRDCHCLVPCGLSTSRSVRSLSSLENRVALDVAISTHCTTEVHIGLSNELWPHCVAVPLTAYIFIWVNIGLRVHAYVKIYQNVLLPSMTRP